MSGNSTTVRKVIRIDEELCDGCGLCIPNCVEGALEIVDGKAKLVSDRYCDGLGACLGYCPQGAITIEERPAEAFDEEAVAVRNAIKQRLEMLEKSPALMPHSGACPGSRMVDFTHRQRQQPADAATDTPQPSELRQWPVKLKLVNPAAPYFENADLLIAADCTAFASGSFHRDFLKDRAVVISCPKFEDPAPQYQKLAEICAMNTLRSITVLIMEVPCCFGLASMARQAVEASGKQTPLEVKVVGIQGDAQGDQAVRGF
ncbi:MAG: 4Fe-4S ferredoxin [Armatimonadetes bacterium]|nr:4Fe-4S ferredoxin [Armatimonadota bacterium]